MGFDVSRVNLTEAELEAAEAADGLLEELSDGFEVQDIVSSFGNIQTLFSFLFGDGTADRFDLGQKLLAIGFALVRDNQVIEGLDTGEDS